MGYEYYKGEFSDNGNVFVIDHYYSKKRFFCHSFYKISYLSIIFPGAKDFQSS